MVFRRKQLPLVLIQTGRLQPVKSSRFGCWIWTLELQLLSGMQQLSADSTWMIITLFQQSCCFITQICRFTHVSFLIWLSRLEFFFQILFQSVALNLGSDLKRKLQISLRWPWRSSGKVLVGGANWWSTPSAVSRAGHLSPCSPGWPPRYAWFPPLLGLLTLIIFTHVLHSCTPPIYWTHPHQRHFIGFIVYWFNKRSFGVFAMDFSPSCCNHEPVHDNLYNCI